MSALTLTIEPADALIDVPRRIVVRGARPGAEVRHSSMPLERPACPPL